jgi:hypothetical protein
MKFLPSWKVTYGDTFVSRDQRRKLKQTCLGHDARTKERCEPIALLPIFCEVFGDLDNANLLRLYLIVLVGIA